MYVYMYVLCVCIYNRKHSVIQNKLRCAQGGQKPPVEQKGKISLDLDFQYGYRMLKWGLFKKIKTKQKQNRIHIY